MGAFRSSMTAEVITDDASHRATGTLFGQDMPRLVSLDDYRLGSLSRRLPAGLHPQRRARHHRQRRHVFGQHSVNIAQMAVGRASPGGEAIGILNLDGEPPAAALEAVRKLPAITSAVVVQLPPAGRLAPLGARVKRFSARPARRKGRKLATARIRPAADCRLLAVLGFTQPSVFADLKSHRTSQVWLWHIDCCHEPLWTDPIRIASGVDPAGRRLVSPLLARVVPAGSQPAKKIGKMAATASACAKP